MHFNNTTNRVYAASGGTVLKQGFLTRYAEKMFAGNIQARDKLSTSQLKRIATIYGHLAKDHDLYELLFEQPKQLLEVDGTLVHTRDLAMFTIMTHSFARGYYWKPDTSKATTDPSVNAGVPLAFLGARNVFGKNYMDWYNAKEENIRCDIFLPHGLASFTINPEGTPVRTKDAGLIVLHANSHDFHWDLEDVRELRAHIPNYGNNYQPKKVKKLSNEGLEKYYNAGSKYIRCLLLQAWCWCGASRCQDMITDFRDWDNFMPDANTTFKGLKPTENKVSPGIFKFMGEDPKEVQEFSEKHKPKEVIKTKSPDDLTIL